MSRGLVLLAGVAGAGLVFPACLDRPVAPAEPRTSNAFAERLSSTQIDKIDLLFMIDNSASMADKQAILATAIPDLVQRLVRPDCVRLEAQPGSKEDVVVERKPLGADGGCAEGLAVEFNALRDIHIAVITSSLGGHGSDSCVPTPTKPTLDDQAIPLRRTLPGASAELDPTGASYLRWDPDQRASPPGEDEDAALVKSFGAVVQGAGQEGCGFESSLEAFYRFLIDPAPPTPIGPVAKPGQLVGPRGVNDNILQHRAEFLRPDSLLAIVVLSDENDCSTAETILPDKVTRFDGVSEATPPGWDLSANGQFPLNYLMGQAANGTEAFRFRSGTTACSDPSSPDCRDCFLDRGGPGCRDLSGVEDNLSLRCWDQKRRFGVDMLYPVQRYVDGLREKQIFDLNDPRSVEELNGGVPRPPAPLVDNPLFQDLPWLRFRAIEKAFAEGSIGEDERNAMQMRLGDAGTRTPMSPRDPNNVFFAAIVGVPWQDIAEDPTDLTKGYLRADKISWDLLRETDGQPAGDPLMREANQARSGVHPVTGEAIGLDVENRINGHEWQSDQADLMFACRFELTEPRLCKDATCDCTYGDGKDPATVQPAADAAKNPLCQPKPGAPFGNTQHWAKAYPGSRFIEVMHRFQEGSIIASICTPNVGRTEADRARADYGYRPAVAAIVDRLKNQLTTKCTPRKLAVQPDGSTPCLVVDARLREVPASDGVPAFAPSEADLAACRACDGPGRKRLDTSPSNVEALLRRNPDVAAYGCLCEVEQLAGDPLAACVSGSADVGPGQPTQGWCYVDNSQDGEADTNKLTRDCASHTTIRLATDTKESTFFITCLGASLDSR